MPPYSARRSPRPLSHHCPPVCAHPTTFRCHLPPLLIVKSPLATGDRRHWHLPCRPCRRRHRCCLCFCLFLPPAGCRGACHRTSCWHDGVRDSIRATRNRLWRAPQTTVVTRGREDGGGEDKLEPPMAVARATVAAPAVVVCHDHHCTRAASFLLCHHRCYFVARFATP